MNDETATEDRQEPSPETHEGPGGRLRAAREARKLSVSEVAAGLRLEERTIKALESDDYDALPGPTFVRGYIRSYARSLDLPPDEVVSEYDRAAGSVEPPPLVVHRPVKAHWHGGDRSWLRWVTYLIVLGLIGLSLAWWQTEIGFGFLGNRLGNTEQAPEDALSLPEGPPADTVHPQDESGPPETSSGVKPLPEAYPEPAPPTQQVVVSEPVGLAEDQTGTSAVDESQPGPESISVSPNEPEGDTSTGENGFVAPAALSQPGSEPSTPVQPADVAALELRFDEDCWVEVWDADGERKIYSLLRAGASKRITGRPPFRVFLGNARHVTVVFNDRLFDHQRFIDQNVARFEVGGSATNP
jgi:cytoskeleton protein RodZ